MKWLVIAGFILTLTPIAVSGQQQTSAGERQREAQQASLPSSTVTTNDSSTHYKQSDTTKPEGWHKLITWPEGIATWALMFTLGAIIWQAIETRRSVSIGTRTLVSTFRPKIIVRSISLHPRSTEEWERD